MSKSLSKHERKLLRKAQKFFKKTILTAGRFPTHEELRLHLKCRDSSVSRIRSQIEADGIPGLDQKLHELKGKVGQADKAKKAALTIITGRKEYGSDRNYLIREMSRMQLKTEKLQLALMSERDKNKVLAQGHAGFDELREQVPWLLEKIDRFEVPATKIHTQKKQAIAPVRGGHTEDAVLLISDMHWGDVIRAEDTSGFPEYDCQIGANRFHYTITKAKQILAIHRAAYPLKRLYVPILGDCGSGGIHDLNISNQLLMLPMIDFSYHLLKFGIEDLLTLTESGIVEEIVLVFSVGNHMRLDDRMPLKLQAQRSMDWLLYRMLIERFKGHPKVKIVDQFSPFVKVDIRDHRYLFTHGTQVAYSNSPHQQIKTLDAFVTRVRALFDSPEYRKASGLEGQTFDRIVIGNIHIPIWFPRIVANGSLNGQNEIGVNWVLEPIPAQQWIFGVSKSHLNTWFYPLESGHIQRQGSNPYMDFTEEYLKRYSR